MPLRHKYTQDGYSGANQFGPYGSGGGGSSKAGHSHELHVQNPDGSISVSFHGSKAAAHRAAAEHLQKNGGTGKLVITKPGNPHDLKPVPARAEEDKLSVGQHDFLSRVNDPKGQLYPSDTRHARALEKSGHLEADPSNPYSPGRLTEKGKKALEAGPRR